MAEYEVEVHLDGEIEIDIDFSFYTDKELMIIARKVLSGLHVTFDDVYVELTGDTIVNIEPMERE